MSRRARQHGFTLIELMVGLVVASIAVGFIFRIYATCSVAYRTQSQLAETMQSLRTAKQLLTKRLRNAGFHMSTGANTQVTTGTTATSTTGIYSYSPLRIVNSSTGSDEIYLSYADTSCQAHVTACTTGNCPFSSAVSNVDDTSCFVDGDLVVAVRTGAPNYGKSCVLLITSVLSTAGKLQHHASAPYNDARNQQCEDMDQFLDPAGATRNDFYDGKTYFMKFKTEGYRIKPSDARGVLQYSPTAGAVNDWQDLAFGFVDMQFALETVTAVTTIATGLTAYTYGWLSSDNMSTFAFGTTTNSTTTTTTALVQIRLNLLARTIAEVEGTGTTTTPSMLGSPATTNEIGDKGPVTLSTITNTSSPYYGNYVYRLVSTEVDLRNLGTGVVQ